MFLEDGYGSGAEGFSFTGKLWRGNFLDDEKDIACLRCGNFKFLCTTHDDFSLLEVNQ